MGTDHGSEIVHRELDRDVDDPAVAIAEIVADLEEVGPTEVTEVWGCIDDMLSRIFEDPPSPEAQVEVEFSYEGYRITVAQDGMATFVETG